MISNISSILPMRPASPTGGPSSLPSASQGAAPAHDIVEFSPLGRAMAKAAAESTMRLAQIHAIRSEIRNGTYETPERFRAAVARLLKSIT